MNSYIFSFNGKYLCFYFFFILTDDVYIDLETTKLKDTNSTSNILDRNTFYVTENPIQNSGLYSNYLIVGVGVVISMFLFMILIQLCKNSRTAKRNKFTRQKRNTNEKPDESSHPRTYRENKEYKTISSSRNSSRLYRPMDIVYHEIDECMEMMPTPTFQNVASKLDCNTVPLDLKHHSSLKRKYDDDQTRKLHLLPSTKITCSDRDKSKLNPQPENVLENIDTANKEETVFYANATK